MWTRDLQSWFWPVVTLFLLFLPPLPSATRFSLHGHRPPETRGRAAGGTRPGAPHRSMPAGAAGPAWVTASFRGPPEHPTAGQPRQGATMANAWPATYAPETENSDVVTAGS